MSETREKIKGEVENTYTKDKIREILIDSRPIILDALHRYMKRLVRMSNKGNHAALIQITNTAKIIEKITFLTPGNIIDELYKKETNHGRNEGH